MKPIECDVISRAEALNLCADEELGRDVLYGQQSKLEQRGEHKIAPCAREAVRVVHDDEGL
jgi:hypothetical protein